MQKIKIESMNRSFTASLTENVVTIQVAELPLMLSLNRSGKNEYYSSLPQPITAEVAGTSDARLGTCIILLAVKPFY